MKFWLGTHEVSWLARTEVPLFISHRRLAKRKHLPIAIGDWALDSGGFTELSMYGEWRTTPKEYVAAIRRYQEIGGMVWAAPQDWMCEPWICEKTGHDVAWHQRATTDNYLLLRAMAPDLPFVPVLQGWTRDDYLRHVDEYSMRGIGLAAEPLVGIGSVCRRQQLDGGREVVQRLSRDGIRLHAFGMKLTGLREIAYLLESSDSLAWSYAARYNPPIQGHTHKSCSNCINYALNWRQRVLDVIHIQQPHLLAI